MSKKPWEQRRKPSKSKKDPSKESEPKPRHIPNPQGLPFSNHFKPGNKLWMARATRGNRFETPEALWLAGCEYFQWIEDNPLYEDKLVTFQGYATHEPVAKMRAMTLEGFFLFLGIVRQTWYNYCAKPEFEEVTERIGAVIRTQKFEGAAADLLNASIIGRDLGLVERTEAQVKVSDDRTPEQISTDIQGKLARLAERKD